MIIGFLILLGLIVGSFLNVCIYRLPRSESLVRPRSHCPHCRHILAWYENIPVVSFVVLRGRCKKCRNKISWRYPVVELMTAGLLIVLFLAFGLTVKSAILFALFASLIVATFIDFERQEIPDVITLPGIILGLVVVAAYPALLGKMRSEALLDSLLGIVAGGGSLYAIGFLGEIVFKKEAMGGGDIKLLAMVGAFIGWKLVLVTFFLAPFFGSCAGIIAKLREGKEIIPYGPYLSFAALISVLWGEKILGFLFPL
ncbi:MAG: prepilin peptidase [Candidatus Omnitrophica bacterium]|nr:prepilin peptidase [Candidatus Omnitrophota bacterium]